MRVQATLLCLLTFLAANPAIQRHPVDVISVPEAFNGVILVASDRQSPVVVKSYGLANQETERSFDQRTQSQIGSISKFLTCAVILRLVDQKKLSLDQPISKWLPFLPGHTQGVVTLRHLLSNTSGIPNGVMDSYKENPAFTSRNISALEAARLWGAGELKFKPGTEWDYSLTNWVLVRAIMEVATAKPFEAIVQEELIAPLGLKDTGIPGPEFPNTAASAVAYASIYSKEAKTNRLPPYAAAAGTIYSSAADLRVVMDAVFGADFLSPTSLHQLTAVEVDKEGYALGGRVIDLPPTAYKLVWEAGETGSYRALVAYEPRSGACVVLLNNTGADPGAMADAAKTMMRQLLAGQGAQPQP